VAPDVAGLPNARQRILATATALFYVDGIRAVGVDRIIAESGVAKATLYQQFRSKEELVVACLERRAEHWQRTIADPAVAETGSVMRRVGAVFDRLGLALIAPEFRGCPFIKAAAEYPDPAGPVGAAIAAHRVRVRNLFVEVLADLPAARRAEVADELVLIYDGAMVGAQLGDGRRVTRAARRSARRLIEAALAVLA
jgi:AcrR family transcriptional regulator